MHTIRQIILKEWYKKPIEINGERLRELFILYDKHAFYNQLHMRLIELNQLNAYKTIIRFDLNLILPKNSHKYCGVSYHFHQNTKIINVKISPWIISRLGNLNEEQLQNTLHVDTMSLALLLAFEHELTHLIFSLWEQEGMYSEAHNPMFECIHNSFFNDGSDYNSSGNYDIVKFISKPNSFPSPSSSHMRYSYNSNSCYLDSLMTIMFFSKASVFRNAMFATNVDDIDYSNIVAKNKFFSPCTSGVSINEYVALIQNLQSVLFADYMDLINGDEVECRNAREILVQCYPDMEVNGIWKTYSAPEIYSLIAYSFPVLLNYKSPYNLEGKVKYELTPKPMFTFWEFMEPPGEKELLWDKFDYDTIVFRNGGFPSITNYGDTTTEIIDVPSYKNGKLNVVKENIVKRRAFAEYILNDKYEMVGAIVLHGVKRGQSGGSHYTAYVKVSHHDLHVSNKLTHGVWMTYNDIGNVWKLTGHLKNIKGISHNNLGLFPINILMDSSGSKPEMYFYHKISTR